MKKILTYALSAATIFSGCATNQSLKVKQNINQQVSYFFNNTKIKQGLEELSGVEPVNIGGNTISFVKKNTNLPGAIRIICNPNKEKEKFEMHYKNTLGGI